MTRHQHQQPSKQEHLGHANDRGLSGLGRYLRLFPVLWRSPVSDAVVVLVRPASGERVIDLGAGMGAATVVAARSGAHVVAIDPTPLMRGILKLRLLVNKQREHVTVVDGAAESLPIEAGSIDALWTVNTVHHWSSVARAVSEMRRVLRAGGRVVLVDEDFDDPAHPFYERMKKRHGAHGHPFDEVDPQAVAALLREHGFVDVFGGVEQVAGRPAEVMRAFAGKRGR